MRALWLIVVVVVGSLMVAACGLVTPESASIRVGIESADAALTLHMSADAVGGCNVGGPYELQSDVSLVEDGTRIEIRGHSFRSDNEECADLATVASDFTLGPLAVNEQTTITVVLEEMANVFAVSRDEATLLVTPDASNTNVFLGCVGERQADFSCLIEIE